MLRKLSGGLLACLLVASLASSVCADSQTSMIVPRVADGSITIDGVKDEIYSQCDTQAIAIQDLANFSANPEKHTGNFWACYDSNYFYMFVEATDKGEIDYTSEDTSNVVLREAVGIMLDFDYNRANEYAYSYADNKDRVGYINLSGDAYDATYHIYANNLEETDTYHDLYSKIEFLTIPETDDGHIIYELALPIPADQDLTVGTKIGLGVLVNDAAGGERVGQALWSPEGGDMWRWSDACGTAVLGELVVLEDENTAPAVEDTTVAPATADLIVAPATAALLAAVGFVVSKKKH